MLEQSHETQIYADPLATLEKLVGISSITANAHGVNLVQDEVTKFLKSLHFETHRHPNQAKESGELLVAIRPGKIRKAITLVGHADTVGKASNHFNFHIEHAKNRITGPGVADDKAGLVVGLYALKNFIKNNPDHLYSLIFVSSPNEEEGSTGFHDIFKDIGENSVAALGLEPALQDGSVITSRNGNRWYKVLIEGIACHSGRFGEAHVNAAHELSLKVADLHSLSNESEKVRVNVGSFAGGNGTYNTICESAWAMLDVRFPSLQRREQLHKQILTILGKSDIECPYTGQNSRTSFFIDDDCPPLHNDSRFHNLVDFHLNSLKEIEDNNIGASHSGGASDINYFNTKSNFVLDGLGAIGGGLHTTHEYIVLSSLTSRSESLFRLLERINVEDIA